MIAGKISEIKDRADLLEGANIEGLFPDHFPFDFGKIYKTYILLMINALLVFRIRDWTSDRSP